MPVEPCWQPLYRVLVPTRDRDGCARTALAELRSTNRAGDSARSDGHLAIVGDLCAYSTEVLAPILLELVETAPDLTLDLSGITFLDGSALTLLLDLEHEADALGGAVVIEPVSPCVRRLVAITHLDHLLAPAAAGAPSGGARP